MVSGNRLRGLILAMLSILTLVASQARLSTAQQAPEKPSMETHRRGKKW